jgi:thiol:disulfide interchange protein DsbD
MKSCRKICLPGLAIVVAIGVLSTASADQAGADTERKVIEGAAVAPAEDYRGGDVSLQLISEVLSIRAGEPFTVGLYIQHGPGYHTYWQNPGVVGVKTTFEWDLPEGFAAGPVQWPAPQRTKMATLTAYGYEGECVLLIEITPPEELPKDSEQVTLKTKVGWMACATTCHPGWSDFELTLPVAQRTVSEKKIRPEWNPQARKLFQAERRKFPEEIAGWRTATGRVAGGDDKSRWLELTVFAPQGKEKQWSSLDDWGDVYFFSHDDQVDSDAPQKQTLNGDGSLILRMKVSQYAPENPKSLPGVLFRAKGWPSPDAKAEKKAHRWMWIDPKW